MTLMLAPLALSLNAAAWPDPPAVAQPDAATIERLLAGEILLQTTRLDDAGGAARAQAVFHLSAEELWAILGDCDANLRFVRGLRECEIEQEAVHTAVTRQRLKPYALLPAFDYRFETRREPYRWIQVRLLDGELRALDGYWRFDPLPDTGALLVTHEIHVQPAMAVPRWLARRTVQRDLGDLLACLRWESRGWADARQRGLDRQRCPD